jgi:hypothetical protein
VWLLLLISFPCFREAKLNYYYYLVTEQKNFFNTALLKFIGLRKCTRQERDNGRDTLLHRGSVFLFEFKRILFSSETQLLFIYRSRAPESTTFFLFLWMKKRQLNKRKTIIQLNRRNQIKSIFNTRKWTTALATSVQCIPSQWFYPKEDVSSWPPSHSNHF